MTFPQTSSAPMAIRSSKNKREGRLYLDVQRNAYAQTSVAPYAVRARVHAPVATPLDWDELDDPQLDPRRWTLRTLPDRLDTQGDPWKGLSACRRSLTRAAQRLDARRSTAATARSGNIRVKGAEPGTWHASRVQQPSPGGRARPRPLWFGP
ncbi:non-homologous end-joining DNA ligase LigD [Streptomyces sp. NPDC002514]|uniref:non-homologous end-joining DNA ligase LigD n=1 Tax=Streptomyces sp. NPDC001270 TaxID=3364554 RepID=UPI0036B93205